MELDSFNVVEYIQQMGLYGVGVRCLPQNLQKGRIRDKEEPRKANSFFLQVPKWEEKGKLL